MNSPKTRGDRPDRNNLGPTGPANMPQDGKHSYEEKHPNAGTVDEPIVGPTPTDDPGNEADKLEDQIDKKRAQTPPD